MSIFWERGIKQRIQIAQEYVEIYSKENSEVNGAILVGSTNVGISDEYADIDIVIIASPKAVAERKAVGKGYNETYVHKGVEICIDWHSLAELRKEVKNWQNDVTLWSLSKARVLLDKRGNVKKLLESVKPYPQEIRTKKLFLHFYQLSYYLDIIKTSIKRGQCETAAFHIYSSIKELSEMLFLIENRFIPIEKWRFPEIRKLKLGKKLLPEICEVMCIRQLNSTELQNKLATLEKIHQTLKPHLVAAGIEKEKLGPNWWKFEPDWTVG